MENKPTYEELQAQVEALRKALNDQLNDCINFDGGKLTDAIMKYSSDLLAATPQQHLCSVLHERDILSAQLASLSKHDSPLQHDLVIECERAMKQRDEWLKTVVSTAGNGGGWDTCFTVIVAKHTKANPEHLAEIRAQAGRAGFLEGVRQMADNEIGWFGHDADSCANHYANRVRFENK